MNALEYTKKALDKELAAAEARYIDALDRLREQTVRSLKYAREGREDSFHLNVGNWAAEVVAAQAKWRALRDMKAEVRSAEAFESGK